MVRPINWGNTPERSNGRAGRWPRQYRTDLASLGTQPVCYRSRVETYTGSNTEARNLASFCVLETVMCETAKIRANSLAVSARFIRSIRSASVSGCVEICFARSLRPPVR